MKKVARSAASSQPQDSLENSGTPTVPSVAPKINRLPPVDPNSEESFHRRVQVLTVEPFIVLGQMDMETVGRFGAYVLMDMGVVDVNVFEPAGLGRLGERILNNLFEPNPEGSKKLRTHFYRPLLNLYQIVPAAHDPHGFVFIMVKLGMMDLLFKELHDHSKKITT
jgi:hypothetical protein